MKIMSRRRVGGSVFLALWLASAVPCFPSSPAQVDPFYLKALSEGERLYAAEDYANAVLSLEIAVFGLQGDRPNMMKALGYFALAAYRSGQADKSREALNRLTGLTGGEGLSAAPLDAKSSEELVRLAAFFRQEPSAAERPPGGPSRVLEPVRPEKKKTKEEEGGLDRMRLSEAEKRVKDEPGDAELWIELYEAHRRLQDPRAAKRTLQRLTAAVPEDPRGPYLLGRILYSERKYRDAAGRFEEALSLSGESVAASPAALNSLGYLILALNALGRKKEVGERALQFVAAGDEGAIAGLDMESRDMAILGGILKPLFSGTKDEAPAAAGEAPAASPPPPAKKKAEAGSPAQTEAAALAYGVFDQFLQENNASAARRTLDRLLVQYPSETRAVFLLAKLDFRERKFEDARKRFEAVIAEARRTGDRERLLAEAAAHLVLCARGLQGHDAGRAAAGEYRRELEGKALDGLGLEGADKQLIRDYLTQGAETGAPVRVVTRIGFQETAEELRIEVIYAPRTGFRTFVLERDKKIIVDLFNVSGITSERVVPVMRRGVQTIRTGMFQESTARVVLDIQGEVPAYSLRETEAGLLILVR
ncbi:MAG: AMIN domain-containing protein [Candidatus Aminicenantes bacterium]|nr:AMIN domain-containing protein [Candidatus Aminicenantes bacterium]